MEVILPDPACHVAAFSQSRTLLISIYFRLSFIQFTWFTEASRVKHCVFTSIYCTARQRMNLAQQKPKILPAPAVFKSVVWQHFGFAAGEQGTADREGAICRHCYGEIRHTGGTTNLSTHMKRHHPDISMGKRVTAQDSAQSTSGSAPTVSGAARQLSLANYMKANDKTPYGFNSTR